MTDTRFARNVSEVIDSTITFFDHPEYWREAVSTSPKYFTHYHEDGVHYFGLSKTCAFRNLQVRDYIMNLRRTTNGTVTQKHIAKLVRSPWVHLTNVESVVREAFSEWIHSFFPGFQLKNASILTLPQNAGELPPRNKRAKAISPTELEKQLHRQNQIGKTGEVIALRFEMDRLSSLGVANPKDHVDHVSQRNAAAGYDIWSHAPKKSVRFIEVKSSTSSSDSFFITRNEIETLKDHGSDAYLYLVHVANLESKQGKVVHEVRDPIRYLESDDLLSPVLYRAKLKV